MNHLTRHDHAAALRLLAGLEAATSSPQRFAVAAANAVAHFVPSEFCTLSVDDLATGRRSIVGSPANASPNAEPGRAITLPLWTDGRTLASLVLNRRGQDFGERDRERLRLLQPHLAFLYRVACRARPARRAEPAPIAPARPRAWPDALTPREREVVRWLAHGKTDAEIAALLGTSPRTVHKHLEHVYVKLGVETRTAAVMRALAVRLP
ncbi:response regulator transcription factor [Ramlibacter algicola]|uniref:helix-turn-helix transcriptional regulator n=1 Tax=Ramlibacter algicola TaxID=2795217 RepID=UPI003B84718C